MKKFLSIAVLIILVVSVFAVTSSASDTYWSISPLCRVEAKTLEDGTVPTFKQVEVEDGVYKGLIVGLPTKATLGHEYFKPETGYSIKYINVKGDEIKDSSAHIGTTDKIVVYSGSEIVAEYGLVTYGDADGDGVFDVIDATYAKLCVNDMLDREADAAVYEAVKLLADDNKNTVADGDYQQVVNNALSGNKEDLDKGRKTPIDQTLNFDSIIYENTGAKRAATVTAVDSDFGKLVTGIKYNGLETAPTASGIYSVTATISDSEKYLVTPGERPVGFIVIAPKGDNKTYNVKVDNTNKKVFVNISNAYTSYTAFNTNIKDSMYGTAYSLTMAGNAIDTKDAVLTALSPRNFEKHTFSTVKVDYGALVGEKNRTQENVAQLTDVLGCYLADDISLFNDYLAEKSVPVKVEKGDSSFDYQIVFRQDEATCKSNILTFCIDSTDAVRGQRKLKANDPTDPNLKKGSKDVIYIYGKDTNGKFEIRVGVFYGKYTNSLLGGTMLSLCMGSTGLMTVLVGNKNAVMFEPLKGDDFKPISDTGNLILLRNKDNIRYSSLEADNDSDEIFDICNEVLSGMGLKVSASTRTTDLIKEESGHCKYYFMDQSNGLRTTKVTYLTFKEVKAPDETNRGLTLVAPDTTVQGSLKVSCTNGPEYMVKDEIFTVTATPKAGYKLSVVDADNNPVKSSAENGWYVMPASPVTVSLVKE